MGVIAAAPCEKFDRSWRLWKVKVKKSGTCPVAVHKQKKGAGLNQKALPFKPGHSFYVHVQKPFRFLRGSIFCDCDSSWSVVAVVLSWRRLDQKGLPPQYSKTGRALIGSRLLRKPNKSTKLYLSIFIISLVNACIR